MPRPLPRTLRLPLSAVGSSMSLTRHIAAALRPGASNLPRVVHAYAFKNDERPFARTLLERRTQLWVYRTNQAASCGDFFVLDLSCPDPARRPAFVVELKQGVPVRETAGSAAWQLRNAELGLAELAAQGVRARDAPVTVLVGDADGLLAWFGA